MVLFGLTFIVCILYLYLFVQDESALSISSLLQVFPTLKTGSSKKENHSTGKGRSSVTSCHLRNSVHSLFTYRFLWSLTTVSLIFLFFCNSTAKAQVFYPAFYPEKELLIQFEGAKTPAEQMNAS